MPIRERQQYTIQILNLLDLTSTLCADFLRLPPVQSVEVDRHGEDYFVYLTVRPAANCKIVHLKQDEMRLKYPDLVIDVFIDEDEDESE